MVPEPTRVTPYLTHLSHHWSKRYCWSFDRALNQYETVAMTQSPVQSSGTYKNPLSKNPTGYNFVLVVTNFLI